MQRWLAIDQVIYAMGMEGIGKRIKKIRKERGISQAELAKGAGVSQPTIAQIESGRNSGSKQLPQIAAFLRVSYQWLYTGTGEINESSSPSVDGAIRMIPLRSLSDLKLGLPLSNAAQYLPAPVTSGPKTFAVTVEGDAMTGVGPRSYPDGTIIYIDPDLADKPIGKRVLARTDGKVVFREYKEEAGDVYLMPINPQYRPITSVDIEIIGTVIGSFIPE